MSKAEVYTKVSSVRVAPSMIVPTSFSMMEFCSIKGKPFPVWFRIWVILSVPYELLRFLFTGHLRFGHVSGRWARKLL